MADRPIRASDIYLAKGFEWGGPDGPGPGSDPIRDVIGIIVGARTGHAVTDLDTLPARAPGDRDPVLTMSPHVAQAFFAHPAVVLWKRGAPPFARVTRDGEWDQKGFTVPGLGGFRIEPRVDGDVIAIDESGVEVARLHGAWQAGEGRLTPGAQR